MKKCFKLLLSSFLLIMLGLFVSNSFISSASDGLSNEQVSSEDDTRYDLNPIRKRMEAYTVLSHFDGIKVVSPVSFDDFTSIEVVSSGGTMLDGEGENVYRNFCTVNIKTNVLDHTHKVAGTNAFVKRDFTKYVSSEWAFNDGKLFHLQNAVGLGAMIISRENKDGSREVYNPIYYDGNDVNDLRFTEDGNYHISLVTEIKNGLGPKAKCVFEYVIPIRTSVYIKDLEDDFDVKNSYAYYKPCYIDTLNRKNVKVYIDGILKDSKPTIDKLGNHNVLIEANGFTCEQFEFRYFDPYKERIIDVYFKGVRKILKDFGSDDNGNKYAVYEAENSMSLFFTPAMKNEIKATYVKDSGPTIIYNEGDILREEGLYHFTITMPKIKYQVEYFIYLTENDSPSHNLSILNQNRFNNFLSKWYEVDCYEATDKYCFSLNDYSNAFNLALSLENDRVIDREYEYFYDGKVYSSISELTPILNANAKKRIKLGYYDIRKSEKLRMSNSLFDNTIYLNEDFMFISPHPTETNEVILVSEDGKEIKIDFNKEIKEYNLKSGRYKVIEKDIFGNKTEYEATIDKLAPRLKLNVDSKEIEAVANSSLRCSYFEIKDIIDELDKEAVVRVNEEFFTRRELANAEFSAPGEYEISCYDRNRNEIKLNITIDRNNKLFSLEESEDTTSLNLKPGGKVTKAYLNGEEVELDGLNFKRGNEDKLYKIYIEGQDGKKDLAVIRLLKNEVVEEGEGLNELLPVSYSYKSWVLPLGIGVISISGLLVIIYLILNRREDN